MNGRRSGSPHPLGQGAERIDGRLPRDRLGPGRKALRGAFTVRREYCHTNGTIAQGGFITAWLDAAMAHAVLHDTHHAQTVFSLEIKVSFYEKVGPGEGWVEGPRDPAWQARRVPGRPRCTTPKASWRQRPPRPACWPNCRRSDGVTG
jgi:hypothetical protein